MARARLLTAFIVATLPGVAFAQGGAAPSAPPAAAPAPSTPNATTPNATTKVAKAARTKKASGPIATLPGFEMQADGSSRVFVEVTQEVQVEEKHAAGRVTYVLKGARVAKRNNKNPLVTVHFNTPVTKAKLVSGAHDLSFVIDLRKNVAATWKWTPIKEGGSMLQIDFPKGDYLPPGGSPPPMPASPSDSSSNQGDDGNDSSDAPKPPPKGP